MTLQANATKGNKLLDNDIVYNCPREELLDIIDKYHFDSAANYHYMVAIPPERETTKSGLFIPSENSSTEQMRTSIGRILSFGSTVGHGELYKDCREFKVGDYVHYAYYAAGLPLSYKGIKIKFLVDDQIKCRISNPDDVDKLYDY